MRWILLFVLLTPSILAANVFVATTGTDSSSCGASGSPCRSIEYAVEQRASNGDTVMIRDGTYSEGMISLPVGVSITAVNKNYPQPSVYVRGSTYINALFDMRSTSNTDGNHEISYIDITGQGIHSGINGVDRNNIHIHHMRLHDYVSPTAWTRAIRIVSSEPASLHANDWPRYVPADGRNLAEWHAAWDFTPVTNIEIDHVTIIDWGRKGEGKAGYGGIQPVGWKDGSIHHCDLKDTNPEYMIKYIQATGGYIENVDIHDNVIRGYNELSSGSVWSVEIWVHINTRLYNNDVNLPFSWTYGHGSEVFNNTIIVEKAKGVGIEGIGQSNYKVYNNYVAGGTDGGINFGHGGYGSVDHILGNIEIYGNVVEYVWYKSFCLYAWNWGRWRKEIVNVKVHHNTANHISHYGNFIGLKNTGGGQMIVRDVEFKNNIVTGAVESCGRYANQDGTMGSYVIDRNMYHGCGTNAFQSATETNARVTDPQFVSDTTERNVDDYMIRETSPAMNSATDLGYRHRDRWGNYFDSTPNYGAYQGDSDTCTPSFSYTDWTCGTCSSNQMTCTRTRTDRNGCQSASTETETRSCSSSDPIPPDNPIQDDYVSSDGWSLHYVDSIQDDQGHFYPSSQAFDDDPNTMWHTEWLPEKPPHPHEIQIDLGSEKEISGFTYLPRIPDGSGKIRDYEFYVSREGVDWRKVSEGTFDTTTSLKTKTFDPFTGRYIRLVALSSTDGGSLTAVAEIDIMEVQAQQECKSLTQINSNIIDWKQGSMTLFEIMTILSDWKRDC